MDRIKQIRSNAEATNSNSLSPDVPSWVKNATSQLGVNGSSVSSRGVAGLGETATATVQDEWALKQEAAAKKLAQQQTLNNSKAQAALQKKIAGMDFGGSGGNNASLTATDSSGVRGNVINAAKGLIGTDYVYGGGHGSKIGPSRSGMAHGAKTYGIDCSGLVRYAFGKAGLGQWDDQATAAGQSMYGKQAPIKSLMPGDLVVRGGRGKASHIAIYLGKGMILEAQKTGTTVHIRSIGNGAGFTGIKLNY
jgi:cell wall-associated NlpC family hydrolase